MLLELIDSALQFLKKATIKLEGEYPELKSLAISLLSEVITVYLRELSTTQIMRLKFGPEEKKELHMVSNEHYLANKFLFDTLENLDLTLLEQPSLSFRALLYLELTHVKSDFYYSVKGFIFKELGLLDGVELNEPTMKALVKISNFYVDGEEFHEEIFYDGVDFLQMVKHLKTFSNFLTVPICYAGRTYVQSCAFSPRAVQY